MGCLSTLLLPHPAQGFLNQFHGKMIPPLPRCLSGTVVRQHEPLWGEQGCGVCGCSISELSHAGALGHAAPCWKGLKLSGFPENSLKIILKKFQKTISKKFPENPSPKGLPLSEQELQVVAVSPPAAVPGVTPLLPGGNSCPVTAC